MLTKKVILLVCIGLLILSSCGKSSTTDSLLGIVWQWTAMQETVPASQSVVPDPQNYTITFNKDDTVAIKADCNNVVGTYKLDGLNLTITPEASTMMYCGDASQDQIFLASLSKVSSFAIVNGELQLKFANDAGKMDFSNGGAAK